MLIDNMGPNVMVVVGLTCSGKSLFSSTAEENDFFLLTTAPYFKKEVQPKTFADQLIKAILAINNKYVVVDSVRTESQLQVLNQVFPSLCVICIHCDARERRIRYRSRQQRRQTAESFEDRDKREISLGIGELYCKASKILDNTGMDHAEFKVTSHRIILDWIIKCETNKTVETRWKINERNICFPKYELKHK